MAPSPGRVLNRAAQDLPRAAYDFVVLGGGLLGVACAYFLREFAPERSVLLVEAGGIPSEEGATHVAPALHQHCFREPEDAARARWLTGLLENLEKDEPRANRSAKPSLFRRVGFLELADSGEDPATTPFGLWRQTQSDAVQRNVAALFGFADDEIVRFDVAGGYGSAEALALHFGHAAVRAGLDLLLNTRGAFAGAPSEMILDRLEANNRMQVEIVRQTRVQAGRAVVVASGANGARLIEAGLDEASPFASCYLQYPRFENDRELRRDARAVAELPVVSAHGFAIRPHGDGALLVPTTPLPPDPAGYVPAGGKFHDVSVGLRGELLERLLVALDALPALSRPSLNLGKTPANLRGAWEALTPSGRPEIWQVPDTKVWQLAGGGGIHGFSLGVAKACELAHRLSATTAPLPWQR